MTLTFKVKMFKRSPKNFNIVLIPLLADRFFSYSHTLFLVLGIKWHWLQSMHVDTDREGTLIHRKGHLPLYSVYPELGNPIVRQHLHRTQPRLQSLQTTVHIMWTSTRNDMLDKNWVPNHFVPLLPIAPPDSDDAVEPSIPTSSDTNSSKTVFTENTLLLLNKFVAVRYHGKPYPGQVIDVSESEVFVRCLHQVGKTKNEFYWPKLVKDECWYKLGNIIVVLQ